MDEASIKNWNSVVEKNDDVYHLGDMALCASGYLIDILSQLNGKIHLIRGNHDKTALNVYKKHPHIFEWVKDYYYLKVLDPEISGGSQRLFLIHYPMLTWNGSHKGSWNLFGHIHNSTVTGLKPAQLNMCVELHDYTPVSYQEVKVQITKRILSYKT